MSIAYFITCHKNSSQIARLINAVYDKDNVYLIHADKKAGPDYLHQLQTLCAHYDNVHFMKPVNVCWGGWSLVDVQLQAMKQLLKIDDKWDYFINLSGQCYPLRSQAEIKQFLVKSGVNHIYFNDLTDPFYYRFFVERQETFCMEVNGEAIDTGIKRESFTATFGEDVRLGMGSQWVMLERAFCEYVCEENPFIESLISYFKFFNIPDEHFIQTVLINSPYKDKFTNDIYRYIYIPTNESHPKILTLSEDLDRLVHSNCLFARKFDETIDSAIMDELDKRMGC